LEELRNCNQQASEEDKEEEELLQKTLLEIQQLKTENNKLQSELTDFKQQEEKFKNDEKCACVLL